MSGASLSLHFVAQLSPGRREQVSTAPELETALARCVEEGRAAWPAVPLETEVFVAHLARIADAELGGGAGAPELLGQLRAADLYLACACAAGHREAHAAFSEAYLPGLDPALGSLGLDAAAADEVKAQVLAVALIGTEHSPPAIGGYAGRGALRSWLRSVGVRIARRLLAARRADAPAPPDLADALPSPAHDPEIAHLRSLYLVEFREALAEALGDLSPRERNLLRQHFLDGLSVARLGNLYRVHRATAARWVAAARDALYRRTRQRLIRKLGASPSEFDSIVRLVRSELEISLPRYLASGE